MVFRWERGLPAIRLDVMLCCVHIHFLSNDHLWFRSYSGSLLANAPKVTMDLSRDNGRQEAILKSFSWRLPCIHLLAVTTLMSSRPKRLR